MHWITCQYEEAFFGLTFAVFSHVNPFSFTDDGETL